MKELIRQDINEKPGGPFHRCPIREVVIGPEALDALAEALAGYRRVLLVYDSNTFHVFGSAVRERIREAGIAFSEVLFELREGEVLLPDERGIGRIEQSLQEDVEILVGVGSGVINDLSRYVSFHHGLPYVICATAPSMDGYASSVAAMILKGMKATVSAQAPQAIYADPSVLRDAPMDMIRSGAGDILGKYSCLNDWKLAASVTGEPIYEELVRMTEKELGQVTEDLPLLSSRDPEALGRLMHSLVAVGVIMSYAGNSRPASGSEHHISHFFEITGIIHREPYFPHGTDVGYSAYLTVLMRDFLAKQDPCAFHLGLTLSEREAGIRASYGPIAEEIMAFQKNGVLNREDRLPVIREKWAEIRRILLAQPAPAEYLQMLRALGYDMARFRDLYGPEHIREAILEARELRDRYTLLTLLGDTGMLDEAADHAVRMLEEAVKGA